MEETEFIKHLHDEKLKAQETRSMYTEKKLAYVTALLGVGTISITAFKLSAILYLVPFVAATFDLYILGEDYSVKRIGAFLGKRSKDTVEQAWEKWISKYRDPFAPIAMPILSTLLVVGAAIIIKLVPTIEAAASTASTASTLDSLWFWVWLILALLPSWGLFFFYRHLRNQVRDKVSE